MNAKRVPQLSGPDYFADPYPHLADLARDTPVAWCPELGRWVVTGRAEVLAVLRDPERFSSRVIPQIPGGVPGLERFSRLSERWLFFQDPPAHTEGRSVLQRLFTPRAVEALRPEVRCRAEALLEDLAGRTEFDLVADYAHPLAAGTIAGYLCAVGEQRTAFLARCRDLAAGSEAPRDAGVRSRGFAAIAWLAEYVEAACQPGISARTPFLEALLRALPPEEAAAHALVLVFAGIETTQNLIANTALELHRSGCLHTARLESVVEECLRLSPPVLGVVRRIVQPVQLAGQTLEAGDEVLVMTAAADRDPTVFPSPERLDTERPRCPHLAFGHGIHYCLGAALARVHGVEALRALRKHRPDLRLAPAPLSWYDHDPIVRGLKRLQVLDGERT